MADEIVNVITPAASQDLIALAELKTFLNITDASQDAQLQMLISTTSESIALECNRVFGFEKVEETWRCVAPVCCPDGTCKIWLSHFPIDPADIVSVESPLGTLIDPADYVLEELTGKLILLNGCSSEIVVTYSGGYNLPAEAPNPLKQLTALGVRGTQSQILLATTSGAGVRMLAHKDSRVMYFAPKDMVQRLGSTGGATTGERQARDVLSKYTRYFI
jgi:Phage gp6-like head-tail connector protein